MSNGGGSVQPGDTILGKYKVERVLGAGNMGLVLLARHLLLEQQVAIKLMLPSRAPEEQYQRFLREARACSLLTSPHVARVLDVGTTEAGAPYMILEYLAGRDLAAELAARGPLPIAEAVGYVVEACEGIADAHAAGIVHRDVKPANLFLAKNKDGTRTVKVLDFGVSKVADAGLALTRETGVIGSPYYMSPEQIEGARDVDARTDVWALGVTLYELLAGKTPFHAEELTALSVRIWHRPPTPLSTYRIDAPPAFVEVLLRCFEKERTDRWPDVAALAAALAPFGPPGAVEMAKLAARTLGAASAGVTTLPEPAAARATDAATGTGTAVMKPATARPGPRRLVWVGVALAVAVLLAGAAVRWQTATREPQAVGPAPASSPITTAAVSAVARSVEPPPLPSAAPFASAPASPAASASAVPAAVPPHKNPAIAPIARDPAPVRAAAPSAAAFEGDRK